MKTKVINTEKKPEADKIQTANEKLYIALVDTPGIFAWMIRKTIKLDYIHVVLSLDQNLEEAYSVGRRNPFLPFFAGFEKENPVRILQAFPTARYKIYAITCTKEQKQRIALQLSQCYRNRFRFHYCLLGLPFLLMEKPFYQKNHYTCSSFLARLLEENGVLFFQKHFSLVTPRDFYEYPKQDILYEGALETFCRQNGYTAIRKHFGAGIITA